MPYCLEMVTSGYLWPNHLLHPPLSISANKTFVVAIFRCPLGFRFRETEKGQMSSGLGIQHPHSLNLNHAWSGKAKNATLCTGKNPQLILADFFRSVLFLVSSYQLNKVAFLNPKMLKFLQFSLVGRFPWSISSIQFGWLPHLSSFNLLNSGFWTFLTLFIRFSHLWLLVSFPSPGCKEPSISPSAPNSTQLCISSSFLQIMQ